MLEEGVPPAMIENIARTKGMPVGPLAVTDEVSLTLGMHVYESDPSENKHPSLTRMYEIQKKLVKEEEKKEEEKKIEENENVLKSLKSISTKGEEVDEWESSKWLVSSLVDPSSKKNKEEGSALDGEKIKIPKKRGRLKKRQGNIFTKTLIGAGVLSSATLLYRQKKSDKRKEGEEGNLEEDAELMEDFFS